jgi:phospholipase/lecithinase/hemolysin
MSSKESLSACPGRGDYARALATALISIGLGIAGCSSSDSDGTGANGGALPPEEPGQQASALFVLGDSLSDVGNAAGLADYLLNLEIHPPEVGLCNPADVLVLSMPCDDLFYRQSRVSDGPVAVEHLAKHLGVAALVPSLHLVPDRPVSGTNYAIASAKAGGQNEEDLASQVDFLLLDHPSLPADAVYVVMIGSNDAIDAFQAVLAGDEAAQGTSSAIVASAIAEIGENLERLLDFGARKLVVANVPDLAALPGIVVDAQASGDEAAALAAATSISQTFNSGLDSLLDGIEASGRWETPAPLELTRFDLFTALQSAQQTIAAGGGNATELCFDRAAYQDSATAERDFHPDCAPTTDGPPRFDDFVFWDDLHPTGAAHASIGAALSEQL